MGILRSPASHGPPGLVVAMASSVKFRNWYQVEPHEVVIFVAPRPNNS